MLMINLMQIPEVPDEPDGFPFQRGWMAWAHERPHAIGCFAETAEQAVGALIVQEYRKGRLEEHPELRALVENEYLASLKDAVEDLDELHTGRMGWIGHRLIEKVYPEDQGLVQLTELVVVNRLLQKEFRSR